MLKIKVRKYVRYAVIASPLAGVAYTSFLPITERSQQFLVLITLLWLQAFILFEVFVIGK